MCGPSMAYGGLQKGLPSVARSEAGQAHLRAARFGGHPSPAFMSEGWSGGRANDRISEAFRGPTRRTDVEKRFVDLQLHQDEPPVTLDPVDAGIEQRPGRM